MVEGQLQGGVGVAHDGIILKLRRSTCDFFRLDLNQSDRVQPDVCVKARPMKDKETSSPRRVVPKLATVLKLVRGFSRSTHAS